jgi:hypothetical protein
MRWELPGDSRGVAVAVAVAVGVALGSGVAVGGATALPQEIRPKNKTGNSIDRG